MCAACTVCSCLHQWATVPRQHSTDQPLTSGSPLFCTSVPQKNPLTQQLNVGTASMRCFTHLYNRRTQRAMLCACHVYGVWRWYICHVSLMRQYCNRVSVFDAADATLSTVYIIANNDTASWYTLYHTGQAAPYGVNA